ncbi:MAG: transcription termination factor Rho [Actinobacteria bacterium]|nr:MAG: transcription termination factor Rho [Actinomycetota bacterium]
MSGEQQLERSVLERKERDELHAIAEAMSLKPGSRTKKADIIDQILRATGVEVASSGDSQAGDGPGADGRTGRRGATSTQARGGAANGRSTDEADVVTAAAADLATSSADGPQADGRGPEGGRVDDGSEGRAAPVVATGPSEAAGTPGGTQSGGSADAATPVEPAHRDDAVTGAGRRDQTGTEGTGGDRESGPRSSGGGQPRNQRQGGSPNGRGQTGTHEGAAEPGNRRSRRRRGRDRDRDRDRDRGDRDLQGLPGGQEGQFQGEPVPVKGLLDLRDEGFGFLRTNGFLPSPKDVYVSISQVRRFALRKGDYVEGTSRPAASSEKYPALLRIDSVSNMSPDEARERPRFEDLTPLFPDARFNLEVPGDPANMTARIVDLLSPVGKGQRGLIVSPPKAGKTTVLKQIAHSVEANHPEVHLMVLLVDERPEEVTDMRRSVRGEVVASTFDRPSDEHTAVSELAIERAKRLVERGTDVVIILDGITRMARAYNLAQPATGRIMSGGVDSGALYPPKKFFGSARNIEEGGSLTILATALVETGSRMDEVIFEEFKGTGNMELRLDRKLAERRIYPAIEVNASSTRHEELLFDRSQLQQVWKLRRVLNALGNEGSAAAGLELLMDKIKTTKSNEEFLADIAKGPNPPA